LDFAQGLGTNAYALIGVWGYDPLTRSYQVYQPTNSLPATIALQRLYPGKGYWVKMAKGSVLQLSGTPWNGATTLLPGWNLVGFPGLSAGPAGKTDFASVFRGQLSSIPVIWTFQGGTLQRFVGYDTLALPAITDLTGVQPGQGYWVYSTANLTLSPTASITLPPDSATPRGPTDPPLPEPEIFQAGDPRYTGTAARTNLYVNQIVRFAMPMDVTKDLNHNGKTTDHGRTTDRRPSTLPPSPRGFGGQGHSQLSSAARASAGPGNPLHRQQLRRAAPHALQVPAGGC
jgi:hypothetical protein